MIFLFWCDYLIKEKAHTARPIELNEIEMGVRLIQILLN